VGGSPPPEPAEASKRAQARVDLAGNYFARGQSDVALEEVKLAIDADPNYAAAYNLRGLIYGSLGDVRLAEESFDRAARLDPRDGNILHNHAWFLCQQGRYTDAHARFEAALKLPTYRDPVRTLLTQGVCYARERRLDMAEATLTRAYEIDAGNPAVGYNLADVLHRRGDYERARFFIRRVNQQEGALNAQTLWLAARIEHRLGNRSGAATFGNQLRSQFPQSPEALAYERGRLDD
jgi:type IV pilus assembly protein PilF